MKSIDLPGVVKCNSGKVREIFEAGPDRLLIVATDRISAFDVVLPNTIPHKGRVLTRLSAFWFTRLERLVPHHLISTRVEDFPGPFQGFREVLADRSMLVRRCRPFPVECVVRGFLAGSGWKEYRDSGTVCGIRLPDGLSEADELPEPIFSPATKAAKGHDENIDFDRMVELVGGETAEELRRVSLEIYAWARDYAERRGILIADTKFEFGRHDDRMLLIDEVLTPDSSRFWPVDSHTPGGSPPSFDKQFIRDYLETLDWDKTAPGPELPDSVVRASSQRYLEALERLTGETLPDLSGEAGLRAGTSGSDPSQAR